MGWNSYNYYKLNVTDAQVRATADAFVSSGLRDAGFTYIVIDDMWASGRDGSGNLIPNKGKFPDMKALAEYVHGKGLKFGLYSNPTTRSCGGQPGSYQHEAQDAALFASWGVDYLKYDWCGQQSGENGKFTDAQIVARYVAMRDALKATRRPIIFAICDKGQGVKGLNIPVWSDTVGHMWRIGNDIAANWARVWAQVDNNATRGQYAGPGGWNDPDMMEAGNGSFTEAENRAHFSLWCIMASPMMLGNNVAGMSASVKGILTDKEATAINQDSLGKQGVKVKANGETETWVKELKNGDKAVLFVNRGTGDGSASLQWSDAALKWAAGDKVNVRDVWKKADSKNVAQGLTVTVPAHDAVLYRLTNTATLADRYRAPAPHGLALTGPAAKLNLFLPAGEPFRNAELLDIRGRTLAAFPVRSGCNPFPFPLAGDRLYTLKLTGASGTYARLLHPDLSPPR